ncbi:type I polyketide synthase [Burkholderia glumae]|uniref:Type I polyketide synthase n=3 Tax=Burkholderia glumae TaxID=337 RepID=A0AAP9Y4A5_BURGL|nr:type I polyketide synthase [Burkholderia glumae]AJY64993.1 zinc-binding dehydrogenase family protein [Burkholderia glumae LMG 2196 = ATCC 33617]MCM2481163.1 type I polyketide synthase [Burkholderia glumae]MCM2508698.1 type I polyketide synthase [Burkholderia glumae]PNL02450.1 type I polyketide synthase [Burkholderia glumae]QKM53568.1 Narbonolide/10-deoxymethynolide synthase PikA2, modules 3 and 4 [Burkholderia glumae]
MNGKIAIVGIACRFPGGANSPDELWSLLRAERDAVTQIPAERFGTEFYLHPSKREAGKSYTFSAGVLDDIAGFDAAFFGISPREASQMDPQQRLLLELAWETFEHAGLRPQDLRGSNCGVFVGVASPDYGNRSVDDLNSVDPYSATGNTLSIASNRVSYLFDLRGPSLSIDTACSSSLVALHQAVQALHSGEAELALAGGVNLLMHPFGFVTFSKASMLSPRGRCRAFDASGDGYVRAEGGAFVLLKPLERALADGDTIHAVIAGSGVNSDGFTQGGISVPGAATQAALLRSVYARAGVDPASVSYLEAHGTGTAVGDPIEARALIDVMSAGRPADKPLLIGSIKTNIGHLETASGMAGLLKAVLCLKHRAVPRSLHFVTPNPAIDFEGGRLRVADRYTPLDAAGDVPLTIGVNSFGFGGTNAHVVLTEAPVTAGAASPAAAPAGAGARRAPLVLSARTPQALAGLAARYLAVLERGAGWQSVAATAARRRQWFAHRLVIAPASDDEGRAALAALAAGAAELPACVVRGEAPADPGRVAFVYSGNGCQWAGMGQQLYDEEPLFRAALDEVDALWRADGSASLVEVMRHGASAAWLAATENAQPLLFAIQVGLTRVLKARGIRCDATIGHSVGEIAAAWASQILSLADAVRVIKIRSRAQGTTRGSGRMAAAGLSEAAANELIARLGLTALVEVAGVNSAEAVTLAGSLQALQAVEAAQRESGRFFQMLDLDYAFHSRQMDGIEPIVRDELAGLAPSAGDGGFVSTVTGARLDGTALDAGYWWRNIREPVRFGDGIANLIGEGVTIFIEVAPHSILRSYMKNALLAAQAQGAVLPTMKRQQGSAAMLETAILSAVAHGAAVEVERFAPAAPPVALPTYAWQHEHYWLEPSVEAYDLVNRRREHPLLGYRLHELAFGWENQLDPIRLPLLADHVVDGGVAFPGAGYVEMALAAARVYFESDSCALENVEIRAPVVFQPQQAKLFRFQIEPETAVFTIETRDRMSDTPWTLNVTGRLLASGCTLDADTAVPGALLDSLRAQPLIEGATLYGGTSTIGLEYGPAFRWVRDLRVTREFALADLAAPAACGDAAALAAYHLHPALMDSGFHPLFALLGAHAGDGDHAAYVPVQIGRVDFLRGDAIERVLVRIDRRSPHSVVASFEFLDARGAVTARLAACRFRRVDLLGRRHHAPSRFVYALEHRPLPDEARADMLPAPAALLQDAAARVAAGEDGARRGRHLTEMLPLLDVLASLYALRGLEAIDAFAAPLLPGHPQAPLVARLAEILIEDGLARRDGERLVRDDEACAALPPLDELWRGLLAESPHHVAELTLLAHCGAALPRVLKGELEASRVLSATGRSLVEQFFDASPTWEHTHAVMQACAMAAIDGWRETRRLRLLEIESTRGDVLRPLAMRVPGDRCERTIVGTPDQLAAFDADASPGITTVAQLPGERFALKADPHELYDLALVDRALAGRGDPADVLASIGAWVAPGGLVVLAESRRSRFADIVFGLQAGDGRAAALAPTELAALCERAGLVEVARHTEHDLELEGTPSLVVARRPLPDEAALEPDDDSLDALERAEQWVIVTAADDEVPLGALLADALTHAGHVVEAVEARQAADFIATMPATDPLHLVFCAPALRLADEVPAERLMQAQRSGAIALAALVRSLDTAHYAAGVRLSVITRGGAPFDGAAAGDPAQATLWGLGRVLANEHPELGCRLIDVDPAAGVEVARLARELLIDVAEEEVLFTPAGRQVPRMLSAERAAARAPLAAHAPAVLAFDAPGSLRNLEWFAQAPRALADDEVEIEPVATGLNFRDVMYAMGLLSDEAVENGFAGATIGMELSGRVLRIGRGVSAFAPGDAVLGFAPASFATRVVTRAEAIAAKPAAMSFEEAATVPTTFFTAYYALVELARLRRGERVLIHGGAGGVGIAAIQIARHFGAEVFATAGSDEKREFVRLLGADHVLDSRGLAFADQIHAITGGQGIDVVLNSLAGEAMVRSIDTLRPFGRFLELGKRDFYENSHIGLRPFRNNISYFGIDADQLMGVLPELTARLFGEVMALFADGVLHPLPYRAFPAERAEDAFRYMQQARQIGKVLVTYPSGTPAPTRGLAARAALALDPAGAYLVIGGTGGLGFATARRLVERGARHLTLASRGGALAEAAAAEVARWRETLGVAVEVAACDVTDAPALDALVARIAARGTPLRGVLHSAMQIDDGLVRNLDDARFEAVLAPKVAGAWNLHRATRGAPLDWFVVYSSATTYLGNPGQASYVAANSFLEALVVHRRAAGLPATFMAWGPLDDVGFLARNDSTREALQARIGGAAISSAEALDALERALVDGRAGEAVVRIDWQALARGMPAAGARRYAQMQTRPGSDGSRDGGDELREQVAALPREQAVAFVAETLRAQIARILHMTPERIALDKSVLEMGMDSLMGMELGLAVEEVFEVKLSVMAIADGATVQSLAGRIVDSIAAQEANAGGAADGGGLDEVAALAAKHALDSEAKAALKAAANDPVGGKKPRLEVAQ